MFRDFIKRIATLGLVALLLCNATEASIAVIGNPNIRVDHLTKNEITNLFLGKPVSLSTGERLEPFDQSSQSSTYAAFYRALVDWSPNQVSGYWSSLVFQGEASPPATVNNDAEAIAVAEGTPGAVSYVDSDALAQSHAHVQVLYAFGMPNAPVDNPAPVTSKQLVSNQPAPKKQSQQSKALSAADLEKLKAEQEAQAINASLRTPSNSTQSSAPGNDDSSTSESAWALIVSHFTLNEDTDRAEVRHELVWFLSRKKILNQMLQNAVPYIYYVYQQTQQRNMPGEFALLPMVESGYDPFAYSQAGATGLWQMMPGTASSFGLDINWWYDARRDTVVSTQAALNYLCTLHDIFHDWTLAAAAYDAGIGAVQAAQQYNSRWHRSTNFWDLPLPNETRNYVPKLLALAEIIKHPSYYGITLPYVPARPYFSAVNMNSQIDLVEASHLAEVPVSSIKRLNPGMIRWATNPSGIYTLLIPYSAANTFEENLNALAGKEHVSWEYHEVRNGETLQSIANNYHTNVALLMQVNRLTASILSPEQGLVVPLRLHRTYSGPLASMPQTAETVVASGEAPPLPQTDNLKQLLNKIYSQK